MPYDISDIVPKSLKSRDFSAPLNPCQVDKKQRFGAHVGKGLSTGSTPSSAPQRKPVLPPNFLEVRNLLKYPPITNELRDLLHARLQKYQNWIEDKNRKTLACKINDPRTEEEKIHANDLSKLFLSNSTKEDEQQAVNVYREMLTPLPVPKPEPPKPKLKPEDWNRMWDEVVKEQNERLALRNHDVPPYFCSEPGQTFLRQSAADEDNFSDGSSTSIPGSSCSTPAPDLMPRPENPTPSHAVRELTPSEATKSPRKFLTPIHSPPMKETVTKKLKQSPLKPRLQGFELAPNRINFGTVVKGAKYACCVLLRNVGVKSSRFRVEQPDPSSGVTVHYTPGLVAAGMATQLDVCLTVKNTDSGEIKQWIKLITEVEELLLKVEANVAKNVGDGERFPKIEMKHLIVNK